MSWILSFFLAGALSFCLFPAWIHYLVSVRAKQAIRANGPQTHAVKIGTPTLGGALILISVFLASIWWCQMAAIWWTMGIFGAIGLVDDLLKIKRSRGLSARSKFLTQSLGTVWILWQVDAMWGMPTHLSFFIPFLGSYALPSVWVLILGYFVIIGSANAANLTDGLDGLVIVPVVMLALALAALSYVSGMHCEIIVFCIALAGAGLGFLWYNTHPAKIFMGDVGSLPLGAVLGLFAVLLRQELVFLVMSGLLVAEAVSVMIQVAVYRRTKKRFFKMAPLHHHFELSGWKETQIVVRFWICTVILITLGGILSCMR